MSVYRSTLIQFQEFLFGPDKLSGLTRNGPHFHERANNSPMTTSPCFARVKATFIWRSSVRKPRWLANHCWLSALPQTIWSGGILRTVESTTKSLSAPNNQKQYNQLFAGGHASRAGKTLVRAWLEGEPGTKEREKYTSTSEFYWQIAPTPWTRMKLISLQARPTSRIVTIVIISKL